MALQSGLGGQLSIDLGALARNWRALDKVSAEDKPSGYGHWTAAGREARHGIAGPGIGARPQGQNLPTADDGEFFHAAEKEYADLPGCDCCIRSQAWPARREGPRVAEQPGSVRMLPDWADALGGRVRPRHPGAGLRPFRRGEPYTSGICALDALLTPVLNDPFIRYEQDDNGRGHMQQPSEPSTSGALGLPC